MKIAKKHLCISGRVQGVGFRAFTLRNAKELNISGWVRNTYDGEVEAVICGNSASVDKMIKRLKEGPRWASVDKVDIVSEQAEEEFDNFRIRS
ncbi:MAG: acylphosphatase [Halanaerobiales bacterium]